MTLSEQLVEAVGRLRVEDLPPDVVDVAKLHILDALGIAVASTRMDYGASIHAAGQALGRGDDSRVVGFGTRLPAAAAALVNGTLIHGLDFDDTHIASIHHATAPALATALAVGEAEHVSGADFLLAYVAGLEVGCRIAGAGAGRFTGRGFHPTGIAGAFASTCVTALLRGDPPSALVNALGLCGSMASAWSPATARRHIR
ncbi:MAG: MmgE/PrpD family protein [Ilumatobacteraceae bacterium]